MNLFDNYFVLLGERFKMEVNQHSRPELNWLDLLNLNMIVLLALTH